MDKRGLEVFLVCAAGAFIGSLVAIWAGIFWPIGLLVGAAFGYFAVEWREVPAGAHRAFGRTVSELDSWGFNRLQTVAWLRRFRHVQVAIFAFEWWIMTPFFLLAILSPRGSVQNHLLLPLILAAVLVIPLGATMMAFMEKSEEKIVEDKRGFVKYCLFAVLFYWLPLGVFLAVKSSPRGIVCIFQAIAWLSRFTARFLRYLFREIHSRIRVLCATYATFGALVGWVVGNPLIGAAAGGVLGFAAYKLLFARIYARTIA